ncbi:hypothetical protein [Paracoccus sp. 22332]|uniref:hypothetical protein n=1 Tax=Paracoccus sp. 22332 TaxID=3453913 RepID=UPI003F85062F
MTTLHPDPVIWFAGLGFRPAVWTPPHRADGVDPDRLVPAPDADVAYLAKWEAPADTLGHGFGFVLWPATPAQPTTAELAGPIAGTSFTAGPLIPGPWHPPVDYPCQCVTHPLVNPPLPEPVPLPASAGLLLVAVVGLFILKSRKGISNAYGS